MRKTILLLILLNVCLVLAGDKTTIHLGESYLLENKNITFVRTDSRYDQAIFCVNGIKDIITEDDARFINGVYIELIRLRSDSASIEITYSCKKCLCGPECSNTACFAERIPSDINGDDEIIVEETASSDQENTSISEEEVIEPPQQGTQGIFLASLIIVVLLLGIIVLWKKS